MATHSSILAWRIPRTEELGGLQSTGRKESDMTERLHFHFQFQGKARKREVAFPSVFAECSCLSLGGRKDGDKENQSWGLGDMG